MKDHTPAQNAAIFLTVDRIEDKLGKMVQDIPELGERFKQWQDGKVPYSQMKETLNKFIDKLNA